MIGVLFGSDNTIESCKKRKTIYAFQRQCDIGDPRALARWVRRILHYMRHMRNRSNEPKRKCHLKNTYNHRHLHDSLYFLSSKLTTIHTVKEREFFIGTLESTVTRSLVLGGISPADRQRNFQKSSPQRRCWLCSMPHIRPIARYKTTKSNDT
jgi:hypothetical protein